MSTSPYAYHHYLLRSLCVQFRLQEITTLATQPGVQSVYRITCHYPHLLPPNSVATITGLPTAPPHLRIVYEHQPGAAIDDDLPTDRFKSFTAALARLKFDRMNDQPDIPHGGARLWLVERAAGSFYKAVLLAPGQANGDHAALAGVIQDHFPATVQPDMEQSQDE